MKHKTALITGASGGLGFEFAKILAKRYYDLVLVARNEGKLYALKNELETEHGVAVFPYTADLSVVDAALDVFKYTLEQDLKIDVLINNAGFGDSGSFADSDWQKRYEMVQLNVIAMIQLTHCFINPMIEQGHGKILKMSSVAAFCADPYMSIYYATKEFVRSFSEAAAQEVKGTSVTVTAFCPGSTVTCFAQAATIEKATDVAKGAIHALEKGKVLSYYGGFTKCMGFLCRIFPRFVTRKYATKMNR
jgi:short-subunit dehydrogenase